MLATLRRIVQEVNSAEDLTQALNIIAVEVKQCIEVDVCSIYLNVPDSSELILKATDGLDQSAVDHVKLTMDEGLVGLVAERSEPVNLSDAASHPRFKLFAGSGEESFHSFLGIPILHHRRLLGVLVVQQAQERCFDEDHVAFLVTLTAQLAAAINSAEITGEIASNKAGLSKKDIIIDGIAGAPGVAVGTAVVVFPEADLEVVPDRSSGSVRGEIASFRAAVDQVQQEIVDIKERMGGLLPAEDRVLFDAYMLMLSSDSLIGATVHRIEAGNWAPGALRATIQEYSQGFDAMEDHYLRERAGDIRDMGQRVLARLLSAKPQQAEYQEGTVLIGKEVSATQLAEIPRAQLAGLVCATGSNSSHVAILARALGVPTVMGAADIPVSRMDGQALIVDGYQGKIYLQPSPGVRAEFLRLAREERELSEGLLGEAMKPATTKDGLTLPIYVNSGLKSDLLPNQQALADGVGLYRTEVPFMVREYFPGEAEQAEIYSSILRTFPDQPVTLRTLDIGGDKSLSYFPIEEDNPFLGYRGIRISLDHPEIFMTQLRAMLRASVETQNLHVLFPMISSMQELNESLDLLQRARAELEEEGLKVPRPRTGVMIEVPSAIYLAEQLARQVDFLSIGTNDLIQYLLAVDRNNARVAELYDDNHPAVLCALKMIVEGGHKAGKPVSVCGEMASDAPSALLLLGVGIDSLSVSMASLPRIKWVIRSFTKIRAQKLFKHAMEIQEPSAIRTMLDEALVNAGLGALVRAGKH
ncbi:MAG: phosphoenolpyruvate-protein phosphotransferase PtsP [Thiothrix sp.]|nr:MAG: phosphoenolpyruvate-protein phosphotransferase PtsP [Thiothrix sp.]